MRCGACDSSLICFVFGIKERAFAKDGGRESPGVRVTFFRVAERKSPKKGRPYCARPFAALRATCDARTGGAPQNSLRATRSVQTTAASQSTKHARSDARATPQPPRRRRSQQGVDSRTSKQPNSRTSIRAIAALGPAFAARGACARETGPSAAQRSNGPCGCPLPGFPSARAEKRRAGGACVCRRTHALRALTCRSCLNGARSAQ